MSIKKKGGAEDNRLAKQLPRINIAEEITTKTLGTILSSLGPVGVWMSAGVTAPMEILSKLELERWMVLVAEAVDMLVSHHHLSQQQLEGDLGFRTALARSTRMALEESREEKLTILANATVNSGSWSGLDIKFHARFMRVLEKFDPEHLLLLRAIDAPAEFLTEFSQGNEPLPLHELNSQLLYPGQSFEISENMGRVLLSELEAEGFITGATGMGGIIGGSTPSTLSTELGKMFLEFCSRTVTEEQGESVLSN